MSNDITKLSNKDLGAELRRRIDDGEGKLTMIGFGTLKRVTKPARIGRNPSTGAQINIPARETITFKAAK